ncbi:bifunctional transaldolase/phosoglucose isomerase [Acidisphaera sp. L21]|uniref:bifunctional transaldolase/phosoglucose isomerase n=1 Tax=Acidisphaera sp. L21 TaxID=1641851 RepID=UPI00131BA319|nr:bifunctional transaldolase/phosoglucose isomerase [Acidisphaera sp. L21]
MDMQTETSNPLKSLEQFGQSPWLDFIERNFLTEGLQALIERDGLKGMTSNPSIFEKAMGHGTNYDAGFKELAAKGDVDAQTIYESLAIQDIQKAADMLLPVYHATNKVDGYVSLEVSPYLALRTDDTIAEARRLWKMVGRDNLMVKVPGTHQGTPAIRTLIGEGMNINVTLLFSQQAYKDVAEAFIAGLEDFKAKGGDVSRVASVASFFVSRIDAQIDKQIDKNLEAGGTDVPDLKRIRGKVAIANAKLAYQHFLSLISSDRWKALGGAGAMPQRLLWASTGTKDKAYSDVLYVEGLIGRDTVNTMPPATMDAFRDHGKPAEALTVGVDDAKEVLATAKRLGLNLDKVTSDLVDDGVKQFAKAADDLLGAVAAKRNAMLGDTLVTVSSSLPKDMGEAVEKSLDSWREAGKVRQLWAHDSSIWTGQDEGKWLAWLDIVNDRIADLAQLQLFQDSVKEGGFTDVLLLGMGGSSLGPEVLAETYGKRGGFPTLHVLDSTDPQQIAAFEKKVTLATTLVIVSSKSGGTLEPNILKAYFFDAMQKAVGAGKAAEHFVAVTDPGSHMQEVAEKDGFRNIFYGDPGIGGRYSVLSNFGMVPAAAMGLDLDQFLNSAALMVRACAAGTPPLQNPGVQLGAVIGIGATTGRDKVTITASPGIADVGAWLEQLLAESTGKEGHGIVPVDNEPLADASHYGTDRVFAYLRMRDAPDAAQEKAVEALKAAGQPVVTVEMATTLQLGQMFFLWEFATAVAGSIIGIDAFNQPDVEASKIATKKLTSAYNDSGKLPDETPFLTDGAIQLFSDPKNAGELAKAGNTLAAVMKAHLARVGAGDYAALLAYIQRTPENIALLQELRTGIRDAKKVATVAEFGPRFLHSTGQAYKGGPNSGVFTQVTATDAADLAVPGERYTFSVVKAAQARGDFDVLAERGRRALRVHITGDLQAGLKTLATAIRGAL